MKKQYQNASLRITGDMTIKQALEYEIYGTWWTPYVPWVWAQQLAGNHFARRAKRRHKRYLKHLQLKAKVCAEMT